MLLRDVLKKENNNLDIFRVVAAFMVIYGHAYAIVPVAGRFDFIGGWLGFDYSGSLAVKMFFFLSGLVVTNSLLEKRNPVQFAISRFFRIWPALLLVLAVSALVVGPLLTTQPLGEYFSSKGTYKYIYDALQMRIKYELPGVFQTMPQKAVNGALWSIPFEVYAYLVLVALFMLRALDCRWLATGLFALMVIDPLTGNKLLFTWLGSNHEINYLAPCFAFGSLLAVWKDRIEISFWPCLGAWLLYVLFKSSAGNFYFFYFAVFTSMVYLARCAFFLRLKPAVDISYGVYLWGWPVQQVMAYGFPEYGLRFNQFSSLLIAAVMGFVSWHLVEKRFMRLGAQLGRKFGADCGLPSRHAGALGAAGAGQAADPERA